MGTRKGPVSEVQISIDIRYQVQLFLLGIFYQIFLLLLKKQIFCQGNISGFQQQFNDKCICFDCRVRKVQEGEGEGGVPQKGPGAGDREGGGGEPPGL